MRALDELQRAGRIARRHGSGTYVLEPGTAPLRSRSDASAQNTDKVSQNVVAFAVPDRSIFDRAMEVLYDIGSAADLSVSCVLVGPDRIDSVDIAAVGRPLGCIVLRRDMLPLALRLQEAGHRVVMIGAPLANQTFGVATVCGNQEYGGYLMVKHLFELGHRHILFPDYLGSLLEHPRWQGYDRAIREGARRGSEVRYKIADRSIVDSWRRNETAVSDYFATDDAPTAIAAWNDREALELIAQLRRSSLDVPGQVSVIGYDHLDEGRRHQPALSTIDSFIDLQVSAAVDLIKQPGPIDPARTVVIAPSLVPNASATAPR